MTTIYLAKGDHSVQLDLNSYPTLEKLNQTLADFLSYSEADSLTHKFLCYHIGDKKQVIQNEDDYKLYLSKRESIGNPDLHQEDKQVVVLKSFEQNCERLISTYKKKFPGSKKEEEKKGGQEEKALGVVKDAADKIPQESWFPGNWLDWAEQNVEPDKQNDFRYEIEKMFDTEKLQSVSYSVHEMDDDLLQKFESYAQQASRFDHCQSGVSCILFSLFSKVAQELGIESQLKDASLWKLCAWKEQNVEHKQKSSVRNFHISHQAKTVIPIIKPASLAVKQHWLKRYSAAKNISFFAHEELSPQQRKNKYQILDQIHYTTSRLLRKELTVEEFLDSNRNMSDDQLWKFILEVSKAKRQYIDQDLHKIPTSAQSEDGVLLPFADDEKIGILGDWGSGLPDSFDLLDYLVLQKKATIILHLGDVYYAGFPNEFKILSDKITQLRSKVSTLRYYTIPGNHDFYTNGKPFYNSLNDYNVEEKYKQKFGFFCLRNESNTVQYIGLDTGYSDSGYFDQANINYEGAYIYPEQLAWAKDKINKFRGQTILLTHHQAFSAYEKILGSKSSYGFATPQVNTKLAQQLFYNLPKISVWYWGHEHKLSIYKPNAYGIPCTRTVGNSSFQVHHPHTYDVKYGFYDPTMPQYNPGKNDKQDSQMPYYDHTGVVVSFAENKIEATYYDMTSSYMQPSKPTRQLKEIISSPLITPVLANKRYRVKDSSNLSYCLHDNIYRPFIWLNYQPYDLIFEKADDHTYNGPITSGMEIYIQVAETKQYFYQSVNSYVKTYSSKYSDVGKFKFVTRLGFSQIRTGDNLTLINIYKGKQYRIGRLLYLNRPQEYPQAYYCLSSKSDSSSPCQIYDPLANNTIILPAQPL